MVAFLGTYAATSADLLGSSAHIDQAAYLAASLCCIGSLTGLASQKTARIGQWAVDCDCGGGGGDVEVLFY